MNVPQVSNLSIFHVTQNILNKGVQNLVLS